jgi:uncharacterized integral membrane protein
LKQIDTSRVRIPGTNLEGGRAIAVLALGLYLLLFIVLNSRKLEINFVFFKVKSNELLGLVVIMALSFLAGYLVKGWRQSDGGRVVRQAAPAPPPVVEVAPAPAPVPVDPPPAKATDGVAPGEEPGQTSE